MKALKAFRFSVPEGSSLQDIDIPEETRDLVRACRRKGTHGPVARVEFRQCGGTTIRADIEYRSGQTRAVPAGSPVLRNALLLELEGEDARRAEFRASKPAEPASSPNGDERFSTGGKPPLDEDLAHHRRVV